MTNWCIFLLLLGRAADTHGPLTEHARTTNDTTKMNYPKRIATHGSQSRGYPRNMETPKNTMSQPQIPSRNNGRHKRFSIALLMQPNTRERTPERQHVISKYHNGYQRSIPGNPQITYTKIMVRTGSVIERGHCEL